MKRIVQIDSIPDDEIEAMSPGEKVTHFMEVDTPDVSAPEEDRKKKGK